MLPEPRQPRAMAASAAEEVSPRPRDIALGPRLAHAMLVAGPRTGNLAAPALASEGTERLRPADAIQANW